MNAISAWSIRNPIPTLVLFVALTVAGLAGFSVLRTNNMPDIDLPVVTVTVTERGAAPSELETQVTEVVENAVAGISGVEHLTSTISDGSSTTRIEFTLDADLDRALDDVRSAVDGIEADLPAAADAPLVARVDATDNAVLTFVVDAPSMRPDALSWYVDDDIAKQILSIEGVASVERSGGVDRAVRVALEPARLAALGITVAEVSAAVAATNVDQPGGRVEIGGREQSVRTLGARDDLSDLANATVRVGDRRVRLADLGTVEDSWAEPRQRARLDGREVVAFSVYRAKGSSEVDVVDRVRTRVAAVDAADDGVTVHEVTSSAEFVVESYDAAIEALVLGALLAVAVVWLFLRDVRATILAAVALPLSLIPTFAVMGALDLSLNTITLLALSLVVGILVDDAIVEIENIVRHMRESGKSAFQAAIEAADEIGLAVVATTATIVAVFVPVAFMPGIPGRLFQSFAIAATVSVAFSLVVARMLTPLMGAYLMRSSPPAEDRPRWVGGYLAVLRVALRHRWLTTLLGVAFFAGSMLLATRLPTDFMSATDRGRSVVSVELQPGSTLDDTDAVVLAATRILGRQPEVASVFASIGTSTSAGMGPGVSTSGAVNTATITADLVDRGEREASQQAFEARVGAELAVIPGARLQFGGDGQSGAKASVTLVGSDDAALQKAAARLAEEMRAVPGFGSVSSGEATSQPELLIKPDLARIAEIGITPSEIAAALSVATLGDADSNLGDFDVGDHEVPILVTLTDEAARDPAAVAMLPLKGTGATVPLGSVVEIAYSAGPGTVTRFDRARSVTVEAELEGLTLGEARAEVAALPAMRDLPPGVSERTQGDAERMQELFGGFAMAIVAGVLLMYLTLVLLFRSFVLPLTILVALPLAVGGAVGALMATGNALAVSALIGLLMLMGIAAKNSILIVEYAIVARRNGMPRLDALVDAAAKRARPIVMTSLAMAAGMAPIALGIGADAESRAPMAIAIVGGLVSSTVLSLVYVPVVFTLFDDAERIAGRLLAKLLPEQRAHGPAAAGDAEAPVSPGPAASG